jgi:PAS domain S-box-containing protein
MEMNDLIAENKALKEQNENLNSIIKSIQDIIFKVDSQGNILEFYASDSQKKFIFSIIQKSDLTGLNINQIFKEKNLSLHSQKLQECLETRSLLIYESEIYLSENFRSYEVRLMPTGNNQVLVLVQDISKEKQVDFEIRKLSLAVVQSPVAVVITDLNANIEYTNPAFENITGYTQEEVRYKNVRILKSGLNDISIYQDLWYTIKQGGVWENEWINRRKNGELYWESVSISPVYNVYGEMVNYISIKHDISQKKKFEQEIIELNSTLESRVKDRTAEIEAINADLLKEIEIRKHVEVALQQKTTELENFFDVALDLLCIADINGKFLKVNKEWCQTLGYSIEELENHLFMDFVHPGDMEATLQAMAKLGQNEQIFNFTNRYRTVDGRYKYIEWRSTPLGDKIYAAARDITERKQKEDFVLELLDFSVNITRYKQNNFNQAVDIALMKIGQFLGTDRAFVFEFNECPGTMTNTYEWCNEGIEPQIQNLKDLPCDIFPQTIKSLEKHENVIVPDVNSLSDEWIEERNILQMQGIKTLLIMPMYIENKLSGFIGLDSVKSHRTYTDNEINILNIWGNIIAGLISSYNTEKKLENSRKNFEIFFNTIDDFLWVVDTDGKIVHVNNTVTNRLEFEREAIIGSKVIDVHPHNQRELATQVFKDMLGGSTDCCRIPLVTSTDRNIPVETRVKFGYWDGQPAIFGVSKDISALQISEEKFSRAFHSGSAMMAISEIDSGEYLDVNKTFCDTIGYEYSDIIGKNAQWLNLFVKASIRDEIISMLVNAETVRELEVQIRSRNGKIKTLLLSADSVNIAGVQCLLTVSVDITERKEIEEKLEKARKEAIKANYAKSEFLSRMSHELRTPLNSILGFAQLLELGQLNESQSRGIMYILKSGRHLLSLINEVLDLARIEAGKVSMSIEPIQLNKVIIEVIEMISPLIKERNITCNFIDSEKTGIFVKADLLSLKQIIMNLLTNAVKYNKDNGLIDIWFEVSDINKKVKLFIRDTGVGISEDKFENLFNPFERFEAELSEIEGTGLGLTVVQKLTEIMGGKVGVESVVNQGSTFWIELTLTESPKFDPTLHDDKIKSFAEQKTHEIKSSTILYIEDNVSNIELMKQIVSVYAPDSKLIVETFGSKAVALALEHSPDLILLDLNLPDMHGSEVLKKLKSQNNTQSFPVAVVSADAMPGQINRLVSLGADSYITKPIEISDIITLFNKYLK